MRILVVSDTHKSHRNLERALEETGHIDMMIHLGDVEGKEDYIEALADCPVHIVSGIMTFSLNCHGRKNFLSGIIMYLLRMDTDIL